MNRAICEPWRTPEEQHRVDAAVRRALTEPMAPPAWTIPFREWLATSAHDARTRHAHGAR